MISIFKQERRRKKFLLRRSCLFSQQPSSPKNNQLNFTISSGCEKPVNLLFVNKNAFFIPIKTKLYLHINAFICKYINQNSKKDYFFVYLIHLLLSVCKTCSTFATDINKYPFFLIYRNAHEMNKSRRKAFFIYLI